MFENSAFIDSATITGNQLTITFTSSLSEVQALAAIVQSAHSWLLSNANDQNNAASVNPSVSTQLRGGVLKEAIQLGFAFYIPLDTNFNPLSL